MALTSEMRSKGNAALAQIVKGGPNSSMHLGEYLAWRDAERMVESAMVSRLGSPRAQRIAGECGTDGAHFSPCRCPDPLRCPHCGETGCGWAEGEVPACQT